MRVNVRVRDAINNLDDHSGANDDYRKGIIVGVVSAMLATGMTFRTAMRQLVECTRPEHYAALLRCAPECWREDLKRLLPVAATDAHGQVAFSGTNG